MRAGLYLYKDKLEECPFAAERKFRLTYVLMAQESF